MQKILIIGSNGYIGRSLTNALKNKYKLVLPSHKLSEIDPAGKCIPAGSTISVEAPG